jgi:hypothetical protein
LGPKPNLIRNREGRSGGTCRARVWGRVAGYRFSARDLNFVSESMIRKSGCRFSEKIMLREDFWRFATDG